MPREPRKGACSDQVARDLEARRRMVGRAVEQTSGVPLAIFGACDPMVEAKLLDDAKELLRHMGLDMSLPSVPPPEIEENEVEPDDIAALLAALDGIEDEAPPDVLEDLPLERLWILADISKAGSGVARQRATSELRDAMQDLRQYEGVETFHLRQLEHMLAAENSAGAASVLYQALQLATRRALSDAQLTHAEES